MHENHPLVLVSSVEHKLASSADRSTDLLRSSLSGIRNYVRATGMAETWNNPSTACSSGNNFTISVLVRWRRLEVIHHSRKSPGRVETIPV
jgi:hypothetical protein